MYNTIRSFTCDYVRLGINQKTNGYHKKHTTIKKSYEKELKSYDDAVDDKCTFAKIINVMMCGNIYE